MIPCDYCEGYATTTFCSKCPYQDMLYADITGNFAEYIPYFSKEEAEKAAEEIKKKLKIGPEYMDPPSEEDKKANEKLIAELKGMCIEEEYHGD